MLITISTPNLCTEYKQLIEATYEQSTSTYVVFVGDGVYAPALNTAFFEQLANTVKSTVESTTKGNGKRQTNAKPVVLEYRCGYQGRKSSRTY